MKTLNVIISLPFSLFCLHSRINIFLYIFFFSKCIASKDYKVNRSNLKNNISFNALAPGYIKLKFNFMKTYIKLEFWRYDARFQKLAQVQLLDCVKFCVKFF